MSLDPRRILEDAAQTRATCELMARGGGVHRAQVVRIEKGGVVVSTRDRRFQGGEDLSVWLQTDAQCYRFEASVIRSGVPVPDRGRGGLMLGFIEGFSVDGGDTRAAEFSVHIVPPSGPPISLLDFPARLLQLAIDGLVFSMPRNSKLVFVEGAQLDLELSGAGVARGVITARVRSLSRGDDYLLYDLEFEEVGDVSRHRELVQRLAEKLES